MFYGIFRFDGLSQPFSGYISDIGREGGVIEGPKKANTNYWIFLIEQVPLRFGIITFMPPDYSKVKVYFSTLLITVESEVLVILVYNF